MNLDPSSSGPPGAGGLDSNALASWDVYPQLDFVPRRDVINGKAGPGNWYDGPNNPPKNMSDPIWIAKNHGPKFLYSEGALSDRDSFGDGPANQQYLLPRYHHLGAPIDTASAPLS